MIGLTSLWSNKRMMVTPEINHRRAVFVLGRIDEILSWEKSKEQEKDVRFVELGEYLCEVRGKQYWRLEHLNSFDEFLRNASPTRAKGLLPHDYPLTSYSSTKASASRDGLDEGSGTRKGGTQRWT